MPKFSFSSIPPFIRKTHSRGQSFLELALILPILIILLLGVVEVTFFIGRYLDLLDLTREAARFASVRDPFEVLAGDPNRWDEKCGTSNRYDFFFDTSCVFAPRGIPSTNCTFCNGLNDLAKLDLSTDDVMIRVFTISGKPQADEEGNVVTVPYVSDTWPSSGPWVLSNHDDDTAHNDNWTRDCNGAPLSSPTPYFTPERVNEDMYKDGTSNYLKGFVSVELYYCYRQVLNLPIFTIFVPNPMRIHVYTFMPLPAAQPTETATSAP